MSEGRKRFGRRSKAFAALAGSAVLAVGIAACGDDEGGGGGGGGGGEEEVTIGLITKTESNPFFVKMKEGAQAAGQEAQRQAAHRLGQDRHRQRQPGRGDREHDHAGREGHPRRPRQLEGDRPVDQEGTRPGRDRDRARHAARAAGRGRRAVRDRQPEGRRADRSVREGQGRGDGHHAEDRDARPRAGHLRRSAPPRRLPEGLRHQGRRPADRRRGADRGRPGQGPGRDGEPAAEGQRHQHHLLDQRALRVRRRERAEGRRQGSRRTSSSSPSTVAARRSRRASRPTSSTPPRSSTR